MARRPKGTPSDSTSSEPTNNMAGPRTGAHPRELSPYVGPSGARRPVGWGGLNWMKDNMGDLNAPGGAATRFPTQFERREPGDPLPGDKVKSGYEPPARGTDIPTGNMPRNGRLSADDAKQFQNAEAAGKGPPSSTGGNGPGAPEVGKGWANGRGWANAATQAAAQAARIKKGGL